MSPQNAEQFEFIGTCRTLKEEELLSRVSPSLGLTNDYDTGSLTTEEKELQCVIVRNLMARQKVNRVSMLMGANRLNASHRTSGYRFSVRP